MDHDAELRAMFASQIIGPIIAWQSTHQGAVALAWVLADEMLAEHKARVAREQAVSGRR